uniref:Uncharacterized protein n=1 Tax=viral metagenome TaxID=1070528 RepID=A0A6M3LEK8_9ZZZZ
MLKTMANRVVRSYNKTGDQEEVFFDPASIMLYISILTEVIRLAKRCREARSIPTSAQSPTNLELGIVRRIVRKKLGFISYLRKGKEMIQSILEVGAGSTPEEISQLYQEVK